MTHFIFYKAIAGNYCVLGEITVTLPVSKLGSRIVASLIYRRSIIKMFSPNKNNSLEQDAGILFVPFLGQSNARYMSSVYDSYRPDLADNNVSGAIVLEQKLTQQIDRDIVTSNTLETNFAIGGSKIYSNSYSQDDDKVWWHPDESLPGGALRQAETGLNNWLSEQGAQSTDEIAIIWSQGEADALRNASFQNPLVREKYKQSTLAVFDYLRNNLDYADITFYIVPTGRFQNEAAINRGWSSEEIDLINQGAAIVREVQAEISLERDDIQLTSDYSDLNTVYEEGLIYGESYDQHYSHWSQDIWHLGHDGLKINGDRLGQYIAVDRGESNVISYTNSFGEPAESISLSRDALLDINITKEVSQGLILGSDLPEVVVGTQSADRILAGDGDDLIMASGGIDTVTSGGGKDVFFFDPLVFTNLELHSDRILDFELNSDRLDVSELLKLSDYISGDPIRNGYITVVSLTEDSLEVQFDRDGIGGKSGNTLAILENIDPLAFERELANQFIFMPIEF